MKYCNPCKCDLPSKVTELSPADSIAAIIEECADAFGVDPSEMQEKGGNRPIFDAKHLSLYLITQRTDHLTYEKAGALFKLKHCMVVHAVRKINNLMETDAKFLEKVTAVCTKLENRAAIRPKPKPPHRIRLDELFRIYELPGYMK